MKTLFTLSFVVFFYHYCSNLKFKKTKQSKAESIESKVIIKKRFSSKPEIETKNCRK
jgi:hypothetical protein